MKKSLLLLIFVPITFFCFGQTDSVFQVRTQFKKGQKHKFQVTHSRTEFVNDKQLVSRESIYESKMEILLETPTYYRIQYEYAYDVENEFGVPKTLKSKLKKESKITLVYRINKDGIFEELENWLQVGKALQHLTFEVMELVSAESPAQAKMVRQGLQPKMEAFKKRDAVEATVLKDIRLLHYPASLDLSFNKPTKYKGGLPNYFGGEPIKANIEVSTRVGASPQSFEISAITKPNEPNLKQKAYNYLVNRNLLKTKAEEPGNIIVNIKLERKFNQANAISLPTTLIEETFFNVTNQEVSVVKQLQSTITFLK